MVGVATVGGAITPFAIGGLSNDASAGAGQRDTAAVTHASTQPKAVTAPVRSCTSSSTRPATLWNAADTAKASTSTTSTRTVLGVTIVPSRAGTITGLAFWKTNGNTGTHTASLWVNGKRVVSGTFTRETASGWQWLKLAHPVSVTAGQILRAAYTAPHGHFSVARGFFPAGGTCRGPLKAVGSFWWSEVSGQASSHHRQDGSGRTNYFVDVRFAPSITSSPSPTKKPTSPSPSQASTSPSASPTSPKPPVTTPSISAKPTQSPTSSSPPSDPTHSTPAGGCGSSPAACGFPDGSSAGVPAGTKLVDVPGDVKSGSGWKWNAGGWVDVTGDGAVFSGYRVAGTVSVTGDGVTVSDCVISFRGGGGASFGVAVRHASNTTVQHCDISGPVAAGGTDPDRLTGGVKNIYGDETGTRVLANDIHDAACGVQLDSGLVQDNYIHNAGTDGGDHVNGVMSNSGGALTIRHNTIFNPLNQTSAIALYEDFGEQSDKTVTDNLLAGGGYTIYGGGPDHGRGQPSNMKFTNNRFSTKYWPHGGSYGPVAYYDNTAPGNTWTGNTWDTTNQPLKP